MALYINEDLLDDNFMSYSLSKDLLHSKKIIPLEAPVFTKDEIDISYARHQMRFNFNHLFVDPSHPDYTYVIDEKKRIQRYSMLTDVPSLVYQFNEIVDEPSICFCQSGSSTLLLASNGKDLIILRMSYENEGQHEILFKNTLHFVVGAEDNNPFILMAAEQRSDGTIVCFCKCLVDIVDSSTTNRQQSISFVKPVGGDASSDASNQMELNPEPPSLSKVNHKFFLHSVSFSWSTDSKSVQVKAIQSFCSMADILKVSQTSENESSFLIMGYSGLVLADKDEKKVSTPIEVQTDEICKLIDAMTLDIINSRLAQYTSETEVNPTGHMVVEGREDYDDFEDKQENKPFYISLLTLEATGFYKIAHIEELNSISYMCSGAGEGLSKLGVGYDVDMAILSVSLSQDKLSLKHTNTFNGLAFIQAGKQNKKFTSFTSDERYCVVIEFEKFFYLYRRRENNSQHKSVHQLVELSELNSEEIVGFYLSNSTLIILTRKHFVTFQLK